MQGLAQRQRKPTPRPTVGSVTIPAPIGGLNTIDAGASMPPTDAISLYNMVGAELGLRTRLGTSEWCTTLTGTGNNEVRSILPFTGRAKDGSKNKLFACTTDGIWDCTTSTNAPAKSVTFPIKTGDAGYCQSTVFVNLNGDHFLLVTDEVNGYYVYTESTGFWVKVTQQATAAWAPGTVYGAGAYVLANGASYLTAGGGTSAASPATGPSGTGAAITDGTATWAYTPAIGTGDPATFVNVTVWGNRVWFTQVDTPNAWYTGIGSLFGTVTKFPFGARFRAGGDLRGLFNWTRDGSTGSINSLVGISGGGDVVVYEGTDPANVASFGLKGVWSLGGGGVPYGRRIATDYGGDLLILTTIGLLPLSRLVVGNAITERGLYATAKIANTFTQLAYAGRALKGWQVRLHPQDNTLLINVPSADTSTQQLVMSLITKGWSIYPDMPPLLSMESWQGDLYFGTVDGRVIKNTGYVDGVTLAAQSSFTPIQWQLQTSFQNGGSQKYKRIGLIRPQFVSQGGAPAYIANARFDYDMSALSPIVGVPAVGSNVWGTAKWGVVAWAGASVPNLTLVGASGAGVAVSIAIRGNATNRTSLVGIDVVFQEGGIL